MSTRTKKVEHIDNLKYQTLFKKSKITTNVHYITIHIKISRYVENKSYKLL